MINLIKTKLDDNEHFHRNGKQKQKERRAKTTEEQNLYTDDSNQ
jgi:hypothetical protein